MKRTGNSERGGQIKILKLKTKLIYKIKNKNKYPFKFNKTQTKYEDFEWITIDYIKFG
jgi:hypothetical protein